MDLVELALDLSLLSVLVFGLVLGIDAIRRSLR
jgi:hypothetical protein